jgi:PEP-CTERM motif
MKQRLFSVLTALVLVYLTNSASAAQLLVDPNTSKLIGADGVVLNGASYNVRFQDGFCVDVFPGCPRLDTFLFKTIEEGDAAARALLDQVFIDSALGVFDTDPTLTRGCEAFDFPFLICSAVTPVQQAFDAFAIFAGFARNWDLEERDGTFGITFPGSVNWDRDLTTDPSSTYAVWTVAPVSVPEPTTFGCLALGLAALLRYKRRLS